MRDLSYSGIMMDIAWVYFLILGKYPNMEYKHFMFRDAIGFFDKFSDYEASFLFEL
jgi:hypothetical protein